MASSGFNPPAQNSFIFNKMDPKDSHPILVKQAKSDSYIVWLLRESRVEGMLTIDSLTRSSSSGPWSEKVTSCRFCLTAQGWQGTPSDPEEAKEMMHNAITSENANQHVKQLLSAVDNIGFCSDDMITPDNQQQTQNKFYAGYQTVTLKQLSGKSGYKEMKLTPQQLGQSATSLAPKSNWTPALHQPTPPAQSAPPTGNNNNAASPNNNPATEPPASK